MLAGCAAVVALALLVLTLTLWTHEDTGRPVRTLIGHTSDVLAVAVTPDGRQVVSGSWDDTVRVWELPAA